MNGQDIAGRRRGMWIIDFGVDTAITEAALYEAPFQYLLHRVEPIRRGSRTTQRDWWIHERPGHSMRIALHGLGRYFVTPRVAKHRLFAWIGEDTLADCATVAFARNDDYTFGLLHSRVHELWARATGTQLREAESGFRYTPTTCFETFPFPRPTSEQREAIAVVAVGLDRLRQGWLNPPGASDAELADRTLTSLYNARPAWLAQAHKQLDWAVLGAYGWPDDLPDEGSSPSS
ncbi:MAG: type IIL restriction-modification enzyme MmeI [Candidatus Limnocylindrales bacterium]